MIPLSHLATSILADAASVQAFLADHGVELIGLLVVVLGLGIFGIGELLRFSATRVWTISSVCFRESIRRRVLWITPLAMLGVVAVCQLGRPVDQQDAIRQTIEYCMFATGFVVTLATIILACTNLPKEIENRVIYTVVTKPPTRLEIALGKVLGFWRVALALLVIMGCFTFAYVEFRASRLHAEVVQLMHGLPRTDGHFAVLNHYDQAGLLQAKTFTAPRRLNIYSRVPASDDPVRWTLASAENDILIPFDVPESFLPPDATSGVAPPLVNGKAPVATTQSLRDGIQIIPLHIEVADHPRIDYEWRKTSHIQSESEQLAGVSPMIHPEKEPPIKDVFSMPEFGGQRQRPREQTTASVDLSDPDEYTMLSSQEIGYSDFLLPFHSVHPPTIPSFELAKTEPFPDSGVKRMYVRIVGDSTGAEIGVGPDAVELRCRGKVLQQARENGKIVPAHFVGRPGMHGQQLRGGTPDDYLTPIAVFSFDTASRPQTDASGNIPFELRLGVERGGSVARSDFEDVTEASVQIVNRTDGKTYPDQPKILRVESNRIAYFSMPAAAATGKFDVVLRCITLGHYLGIHSNSLRMVSSANPFGYNLARSLLVMWLLALLVVVVAVFCSTFLSWPIAVVLTIVILLGHWGVLELGDAAQPGIGHMVVQDLFRGATPSTSQVVSSSVEGLTRMLNVVSKVLPDVSQFPAMQYAQDGVLLPWLAVLHSLLIALGFGIPLFVLAFVFLKRKEVAL